LPARISERDCPTYAGDGLASGDPACSISTAAIAPQFENSSEDADGKQRYIGRFKTQEAAAHAYNAAIRALPPEVQARRKTNPVVDGRLVPRPPRAARKRRREEPAAPPPAPSRRRVVSAPPPPARDDVALDRTAAYLQTAPTPDDAEGFRAAAGLALTCIDAWHAWNAASI